LRDLRLEDDGTGPLPEVSAGEVYPCPAVVASGFVLLCRTEGGGQRLALLPVRDPWGRVTARAWLYDLSMPSNTVSIQTAQPLKPGYVPLKQGKTLPVVASDGRAYTLRYVFRDYVRDVVVEREDLVFHPPPPPETDPAKRKELALAQRLEAMREREEALRMRLQTAMENTSRIVSLLQEMDRTSIETAGLQAEISRHEKMYRALAMSEELEPGARRETAARIAEAAQQHGAAETGLERLRRETAAMRDLRSRLHAIENDLAMTLGSAAAEEATLRGLVKAVGVPGLKDLQQRLGETAGRLAEQNAQLSRQTEQMTAAGWMTALLGQLADENVGLRERVAELQAELQALKDNLDKAEAALQADVPAAP
jgi:hypothetical protein